MQKQLAVARPRSEALLQPPEQIRLREGAGPLMVIKVLTIVQN